MYGRKAPQCYPAHEPGLLESGLLGVFNGFIGGGKTLDTLSHLGTANYRVLKELFTQGATAAGRQAKEELSYAKEKVPEVAVGTAKTVVMAIPGVGQTILTYHVVTQIQQKGLNKALSTFAYEAGTRVPGALLMAGGAVIGGAIGAPAAGGDAGAVASDLGTTGAAEGPTELPAFSQSTVNEGVESAAEPYNKYISEGARALDKRVGAGSAPFQGIDASTESAQAIVRDILEYPTKTVFGARTYDVYNTFGQGARFDVGTNRFITFLDENIATR
jgi:hypothetical protein